MIVNFETRHLRVHSYSVYKYGVVFVFLEVIVGIPIRTAGNDESNFNGKGSNHYNRTWGTNRKCCDLIYRLNCPSHR